MESCNRDRARAVRPVTPGTLPKSPGRQPTGCNVQDLFPRFNLRSLRAEEESIPRPLTVLSLLDPYSVSPSDEVVKGERSGRVEHNKRVGDSNRLKPSGRWI